MHYSLDRIEENMAVLIADNGDVRFVPLMDLPQGAAEGKIYCESEGIYTEDSSTEEARRAQIRALQNRLRKR